VQTNLCHVRGGERTGRRRGAGRQLSTGKKNGNLNDRRPRPRTGQLVKSEDQLGGEETKDLLSEQKTNGKRETGK